MCIYPGLIIIKLILKDRHTQRMCLPMAYQPLLDYHIGLMINRIKLPVPAHRLQLMALVHIHPGI
jgi:hypothetical protein